MAHTTDKPEPIGQAALDTLAFDVTLSPREEGDLTGFHEPEPMTKIGECAHEGHAYDVLVPTRLGPDPIPVSAGRRHSHALAVFDGACNPSGIAHEIVNACAEIRAAKGWIATDPALKLMVAQLAYVTGVWNGVAEFGARPTIAECLEQCRRLK